MSWLKALLEYILSAFKTTPSPVPTPAPIPNQPSTSDVITQLLDYHNKARIASSLPTLRLNPMLTKAAQLHTEWMAAAHSMTHYEPTGGGTGLDVSTRVTSQGYHWSRVGENIAEGYNTVEAVMTGWMNSPGHKANILGSYQDVGFGYVVTMDLAKNQTYWWTTVFAYPAIPGVQIYPPEVSQPLGISVKTDK